MGLILLARDGSPLLAESGEPEEEDLGTTVGSVRAGMAHLARGLEELGLGLAASPSCSSFLTLRSSGWSWTGLRPGSCWRGPVSMGDHNAGVAQLVK